MKIKYIYTHDTDPEKEKVTVHEDIKNINDIEYTAVTKIEGQKYIDVTAHDDGNGFDVYLANRQLRVDYHEMLQLHSILDCMLSQHGYVDLKVK